MSTKGVGRPKEGNPEETRRAILRAAVDSFARAGFAGATTRNVALKAGVNVATLHYHFGSKEGLYRAVWDDVFREKPAVNGYGLGPGERLLSVLTTLLEHGIRRPWLSRLALQQLLSPVAVAGGLPEDPRVPALQEALRDVSPSTGEGDTGTADLARRIVALLDATVVSLAQAGGSSSSGEGAAPGQPGDSTLSLPQEARRLLEAAAVTLARPALVPRTGYREVA
ncbi:MAG: TetR/AcrR family transcriptional regulator [Acidobacteria bacterium]|nr:TetR/AcrR family transcriptional regulator [Acidobacteriota bacterium]MCG3194209.1 hypothetical protein [Thermoanaerobaculia bacterium]MCK6681293.1 TetR/AcrR family transcriptional regulator [Thermoanaerobaculia bacterium]